MERSGWGLETREWAGDLMGIGKSLNNIVIVHAKTGDYTQVLILHRRCLDQAKPEGQAQGPAPYRGADAPGGVGTTARGCPFPFLPSLCDYPGCRTECQASGTVGGGGQTPAGGSG